MSAPLRCIDCHGTFVDIAALRHHRYQSCTVRREAAHDFWAATEVLYHPWERARAALAGQHPFELLVYVCRYCGEVFVGGGDAGAHRCVGYPMLGCLNIGLVISVALRLLCNEPVPPEPPQHFILDATQHN